MAASGSANSVTTNKLAFNFEDYNGKRLYVRELTTGRGYRYTVDADLRTKSIILPTVGGQTARITFDNRPTFDPINFQLLKLSDKSGESDGYSGSILSANAEFTVNYYYANADGSKGNLARTWIYKTDENGLVEFRQKS